MNCCRAVHGTRPIRACSWAREKAICTIPETNGDSNRRSTVKPIHATPHLFPQPHAFTAIINVMIIVPASNCIPPASRCFHWLSSSSGDAAVLSALNQRMGEYYSQISSRETYQTMLNARDEAAPGNGTVTDAMLSLICGHARASTTVLEIGCGNGRIYRQSERLDSQESTQGWKWRIM